MNEKYFALPIEKQQRILDAAYCASYTRQQETKMLCYDEYGNRENPAILMWHAETPHCKPMVLQKANHDFLMRNADELNMILAEVFTKHAKNNNATCSLHLEPR